MNTGASAHDMRSRGIRQKVVTPQRGLHPVRMIVANAHVALNARSCTLTGALSMMSALEDVPLSDNVVPAQATHGVPSANGETNNEGFETVALEACASRTEDVAEREEDGDNARKESWTTYELSKGDGVTTSTVPQSPAVSEITPVEEDTQPEFLDSAGPVQIFVSNPKKAEEISKLGIRSTFTSYYVQSETSLADYPFTKRAVWRRFKDFDTLHRLLRENHRGYIIPPLPSKNFFESKRGKDTFIKERQIELNQFLCQVALHPNLYNTDEMKVFLGCPEELSASHEWYRLMESAKQLAETTDPTPTDLDRPVENMKRDVTNILKKVGSTIKRDVLHRSYSVSETERTLQDTVPKLKQLELQLNSTVELTQKFTNLFEGVGNELGLLGRIWLTIARFEEGFIESTGQYTDAGRALIDAVAVLHKSGYAAVRVQQICNKSTALLRARSKVLSHHSSILPAVLLSLHDRTLVLRHLCDAQSRLESSRRSLDMLTRDSSKKLGGTANFSNKSAVLSQEIRSCVDEVSKRTEMYDVVTQRNLTELERQRQQRETDLVEMSLSIAKMQQEYYETVSLVWVNLAEEISRMLP